MLKRNLNFIEIGRADIPGGILIRMKMYKVVAITSAIATAIYVNFSFFSHPMLNFLLSIFEGLTVFMVGGFFIVFISPSAFVNEPLWLDLSVMTPMEFAGKYLLVGTFSAFIIFLPISVSLILLNPLVGIGSLFIPILYIYTASLNASFYRVTIYDIKAGLLAMTSLIPIALDAFFPIGGAVVTLAFTLPFLFSKGYWERTFEKIITSV